MSHAGDKRLKFGGLEETPTVAVVLPSAWTL